MSPPENHSLSDDDIEDEDFINPDINHISGNQLRATAELHTKPLGETGIVSTIMGEEDTPEECLEHINISENDNKSKRMKIGTSSLKWQSMDLPFAPEPNWEQPEWIQNSSSPVELFEMFFDGILLLSGYCSVPRYQMYWETSSDTHNEAISKKASLEEASTLKNKVRGSYSQMTDTSSGITWIRYHDNNIVTVASIFRGVKPIAPKGKEDTLDLLSFTRYIVQTYLAMYSIRVAPGPSPKTLKKILCSDKRLDGFNHVIVKSMKQVRCGECHKNTTRKCKKCNVGCHVHC
uniref:PiggyBac transposable element-derived protein domain-containing protein n=1 Tax=Timema tahoe TaxID=61484 RepID=A0A7R9IH74_9NEOP|nr:unnamed protein product [Timema tahoe]